MDLPDKAVGHKWDAVPGSEGLRMQVLNRRNEDRVAAAVKQAEAKAAAAAKHAFSSRELFTLDWANTLLGATWAPALEQLLSAKLTATLEARSRQALHVQALFGRISSMLCPKSCCESSQARINAHPQPSPGSLHR